MIELSSKYWHELAKQTLFISSLLAGFSIAIIANLIVSEINTRFSKLIMIFSSLAAGSFLITVFAMTKLLMMTTDGYPFKVVSDDLMFPRMVGFLFLYLGVISLISIISLFGWTKSKKMGIFSTLVGVFTLIFILMMSS